ncbi:hypothetical protein ACIGZJ_21230, partial [Kitasatospora sp. NPDC052868]
MSFLSEHRRTAVGVVALTTLAISCGTATASSSAAVPGKVLWTPSTGKGPSSFAAVQCAAGGFGVVKDSAKGSVWRAFQAAGE